MFQCHTQTIVVVIAWYLLAWLSLCEDDQSAFYLLDKAVLLTQNNCLGFILLEML